MKQDKKQLLGRSEASEQIKKIFETVKSIAEKDEVKSSKLLKKARRLVMHYRIKLSKAYKGKFCKKCNTYFIYGKTVRVRNHERKISYSCLNCGAVQRYIY